ncbi:hypothetical protein EYZ11_012292 [Aspergillus tanneri]|uniref:Uncharacterized protein n=1 Tax=Aspergillus tanneri TaxID=1220188 RepID=A0A4S3J0L9_9EURO|nr:hypothetical protein EYZ11_012292 [Aspergillus tanneri]
MTQKVYLIAYRDALDRDESQVIWNAGAVGEGVFDASPVWLLYPGIWRFHSTD